LKTENSSIPATIDEHHLALLLLFLTLALFYLLTYVVCPYVVTLDVPPLNY